MFDLPAEPRKVTEHAAERRRCECGWETTAAFPADATAPACLGDLGDWLADEPVVNVDETGSRVAGAKWWFHVAATALLTFLGVHRHRGVAATDAFGILPRVRGTLVHDRWPPYWRYRQATHAICNAHVLRDLASVGEVASQKPWADAMAELLVEAKRKADAARAAGLHTLPRGQRAAIRARFNRIVADALAANPDPPEGKRRSRLERDSYNLALALRDHAIELLRFTSDLRVPFDNNQAERDLRMAKLQQKISGCFRTDAGAGNFAVVRNYIETGRKHGLNPIDLLIALFNNQPWTIPSSATSIVTRALATWPVRRLSRSHIVSCPVPGPFVNHLPSRACVLASGVRGGHSISDLIYREYTGPYSPWRSADHCL